MKSVSIILKYPVSSRISDYQDVLVEGNVVIARYILEGERGECYAFRSTIKHITKYPENFIILHYPEKIESRQLRLQQRITTHLPASIMVDIEVGDGKGVRLNGIIADISIQGVFVCIHHPSTGDVKIPAQVCNSRNEQGKVSVGIKFFDDDEQVKNLLEHLFIDQNML